ncbi:membrane protein of unknown function [Desulfotomaculum nigrificans CO-1-SRB]|uniref:Phage holin family protein n=1 Tax=Desulfotomaculum nigrificans (strain DSM 14880 / VKM B-2319 / CO-1-SRB) TaxID=868595 RepID=F6B495_DESCC|nr:phage holin family protein [Desulfotomaculum nigrificans]AEF95272.1 membrane protein of unknown function [Desulfotomaculum nigrificans CO-1-SRB]
MNWLLRLLLNSLALVIAGYLISGIHINGLLPAIIAVLLLGFVNTFIKPVLVFFTFPITLFTLGFFILIINAITFGLVAWLVPGFVVDSFGAAFMGAIITSVVGWLLNVIFN